MLNLYAISSNIEASEDLLGVGEKISIKYHDLFDYPLDFADILKWKTGEKGITGITSNTSITRKNRYYYLEGREGLIYKRLLRKRISAKKLLLAKKDSKILFLLPSVKMVAVTGSLAMENSSEDSDIDLMIVTKKGSLWSTRLVILVILVILQIPFRRAGKRDEANKLCLNMWLDESDLVWKKYDRNLYTAHEIAQITPLVNKGKTYEKFIDQNKWILGFWPNAVRIIGKEDRGMSRDSSLLSYFLIPFEKLAFNLQKLYMRKKITREVITPTRALFHPQDWGKVILKRLNSI